MGNRTVIPNDLAVLAAAPMAGWRPAQPASKNTSLDFRQRAAAQDCLLESATLNESAIMLLLIPRMKNSTGCAEFLRRMTCKQAAEPVRAGTDRTGSEGIKVSRRLGV
jgi:hypothetical protein